MNQFFHSQFRDLILSVKKDLTALKNDMRRRDWLFFLCTLPILLASLFADSRLFKIGLPLPALNHLGTLPGSQSPKIYLFELYLFCSFSLYTPLLIRNKRWGIHRNNGLQILAILFFIFAMLRLGLSFPQNIALALRNSAFAWYLVLPILISQVSIPPVFYRVTAKLAILGSIIFFAVSVIQFFYIPGTIIDWHVQIGIYSILIFWVFAPSLISGFLLLILGIGIGIDATLNFQRTSLLGLGITYLYLCVCQLKFRKNCFSALLILAIVFSLSFFLAKKSQQIAQQKQNSVFSFTKNAFTKSESTGSGLEVFRWSMWKDACEKFLQNPVIGIGFENQVVHRVYKWSGIFVPNDENWMKSSPTDPTITAPIAGPHNSYLNAITRLGIFGFLLLLLHLLALKKLLTNQHIYVAAVFFGQFLYACFNVGLEGPARSALLLIMLGLALSERQK